jgi:hypothetical protein
MGRIRCIMLESGALVNLKRFNHEGTRIDTKKEKPARGAHPQNSLRFGGWIVVGFSHG